IPCETQSPRPVPFPGFVEKNGSKICARTSSAMPWPVSRTWICTASRPKSSVSAPAPLCVATVMAPPFGIESAAFAQPLDDQAFRLLDERVHVYGGHGLGLAVETKHLTEDARHPLGLPRGDL